MSPLLGKPNLWFKPITHKEVKRRCASEEVKIISWFPHSLLIHFSLCKNILNHRAHRGAARYIEKTNYYKEIMRRCASEEVKIISWFPHSFLIHFSLCKNILNHREHRGASRYTEKTIFKRGLASPSLPLCSLCPLWFNQALRAK